MLSEHPFNEYSVSEIAGEVGRGIMFLIGFSGVIFFLLMVVGE